MQISGVICAWDSNFLFLLCVQSAMRLLFYLFAVALQLNVGECGIRRFLRYDVECPYLTREEYNKRVIVGRCPPTTTANVTATT